MLNWYHQSWQETQDMPLEKGWELIGNISRISAMYNGEQPTGSGQSGGQIKPGEMGTPSQIFDMVARIEAENKRKEA